MQSSYLRTFGGFQLVIGATEIPRPPTLKACSLAAYLILSGGAAIGRERLLELLWPEIDPERGRANLKTAMWSLRDVLRKGGCDPDAFLSRERSVVQWIAPTTSDAAHLLRVDPAGPVEALAEAVGLVTGEFLEGIFDEWVVLRREELARRYDALVCALFVARPTAETARLALQRDPYDSGAVRVLADEERRAGRTARALDLIEAHRTALDELGESLAPDLAALVQTLRAAGREDAAGPSLPFVGRSDALAWLETRAAEREGRACALVVGEAGIGKTSLLRAFVDRLRRADHTVHALAALPHDARPFEPWSSLLEALTGTTQRAVLADVRHPVTSALAGALADALPTGAVLVLDDAHWLSGDAQAVLRDVAPQLRRKGVVPVVATRPDAAEALRTLLSVESGDELRLHPLTREDVLAALDVSVEGDVGELADALHRRSDGVPLYVAHLVTELGRAGVLARSAQRWRLVRTIDAGTLPTDSLRAAIAAPLRALGEDAVLAAAALAIEPHADDDDLCAALGWEAARFDAVAEKLIRAELLVERPDGLAFAHDLVAQVAGGLATRRTRLALHRAFAARVARWPDREAPLWTARHHEALGERWEAAVAYRRAGDIALYADALHDAVARYRAALAMVAGLVPDERTRALATGLYRAIASSSFRLGDRAGALAAARAAVDEACASGDRKLLAQAFSTRANQLVSDAPVGLDELHAAAKDADEAVRLTRECGEREELVASSITTAIAYGRLGEFDLAEAAAREAVDHAVAMERWDMAVGAADRLARLYTMRWRFDEALAQRKLAESYARRTGSLAEGTVHDLLADVWFALERYDDALAEVALGEASIEHADLETSRWRLPRWSLAWNLTATRFNIVLARGDLDAAEIVLASLVGRRGLDAPGTNPALGMYALRLLVERGDPGALRRAADLARGLPRDFAFDQFHWSDRIELLEARIAAGLGERDARARLAQSFTLLDADAAIAPMTADRAFAALAAAARKAGDDALAERAARQSQHYRAQRIVGPERKPARALRVV
ncbi:MAG TPA: AAA family ATPase [Candidatus Sulfotelmatobacter sp.]|nr:AAA family ATPase [Candidatus Sulfotelmatobacter sp.]